MPSREVAKVPPPSLLEKFGSRYGVAATKVYTTLQKTAFKGAATEEQFIALMIVADQYGLNPFTKEIYAFPSDGGVVPVVGVDGWLRIINEQPQFDGLEFTESEDTAKAGQSKDCPVWIECTIYRKDRTHATTAREYLEETYRNTGPWNSHTKRMLRHKALIQCARIAFGFTGIYDPDEAERVIEGEIVSVIAPSSPPKPATKAKLAKLSDEMVRTGITDEGLREWLSRHERVVPDDWTQLAASDCADLLEALAAAPTLVDEDTPESAQEARTGDDTPEAGTPSGPASDAAKRFADSQDFAVRGEQTSTPFPEQEA